MERSRVTGALAVLLFAAFTIAGPVVIAERRVSTSAKADPAADRAAKDAPVVAMQNIKFQPGNLVVDRGATVRFDNKDVVPHTVTIVGVSDSGLIAPGRAYSLTVTKPFTYICTVHKSMTATIELSG